MLLFVGLVKDFCEKLTTVYTLYLTIMRVVEPHQFQKLPKKKPKKPWLLLVCAIVIFAGSLFLWLSNSAKPPLKQDELSGNNKPAPVSAPSPRSGALKQFTGEQFKQLYQSMVYPNTQQFSDLPPITGNTEADARIRSMAEAKGYQPTSVPSQAIVKINEPRLDNDDLLQPLAAQGWGELKAASLKDNISLSLISAYRSPEYQRNLFMQRLQTQGATPAQVAAARADIAVQNVLNQAALPGYSRHHTGYVVDLWCEDGSSTFLSSSCFKWISANNYQHAKEYGWIPSYPEGANEQGPEPEPWEYVWVGRDRLIE